MIGADAHLAWVWERELDLDRPARRPPEAGTGAGNGEGAGQARLAGVARGSALNMAGAAVAGLTTIVVTALATRHFDKPVAGAFFTAISLFLIVRAVAGLGANVGAVNFIARLRSLGQPEKIPLMIRAALIPVVVVSVTVGVALFLGAEPLAHLALSGKLGQSGATPAMVAETLRAFGLVLPFAALLDGILGATRGYRDMRPTVFVDNFGRSIGQLAGVVAAVVAGSAALLAPLWSVPYIPAAIIAWLWLSRIRRRTASRMAATGPKRPRPKVARTGGARALTMTTRGFWLFTAPRALASVAQIIIQRFDIVLVAILRGPAEAAVYTAATRFLVAGQFANSAINWAAQPWFAELFAVNNRRGAGVVYKVTTAWLILLTWPLYLLCIVFGPEVLTVFGRSYRAGDTVLVILSCAMLLVMGCGQVDMILVTSGRSSWSLMNGILAVVVNVGLDLYLIPRYGITGAAIGWAITFGVTNLMPLTQIAVTMRLNPFGRGSLIAMALTTFSFFVVPLTARALLGRHAAVSVAALALGCVLLAVGLWRFRGVLRLSVMPGVSVLQKRFRPQGAHHVNGETWYQRPSATAGRSVPWGADGLPAARQRNGQK